MTIREIAREWLLWLSSSRRRAARRLPGSPFCLRLHYQGGHPGICRPGPYWIGWIGDRLRMVDASGERTYDLPLKRINRLTCQQHGQVHVWFEPTPGLNTTVQFLAENPIESRRHLLPLIPSGL